MKNSHTNQCRQPRLDEIKHAIKRIRVFPIPLLIPVMLLPFLGPGVSVLSILLILAASYWIYREMRKHRNAETSYQAAIQKGWRQTIDCAQTDVRFRNLLILFSGGLFYLFLLCPPLGILGAISAAYFVLISPNRFSGGKRRVVAHRQKLIPQNRRKTFKHNKPTILEE